MRAIGAGSSLRKLGEDVTGLMKGKIRYKSILLLPQKRGLELAIELFKRHKPKKDRLRIIRRVLEKGLNELSLEQLKRLVEQ